MNIYSMVFCCSSIFLLKPNGLRVCDVPSLKVFSGMMKESDEFCSVLVTSWPSLSLLRLASDPLRTFMVHVSVEPLHDGNDFIALAQVGCGAG